MKSKRLLMSIIIMLSMLAGSALAAPTAPDSPNGLGTLTQLGMLESGNIKDLAVKGNYAFAGFGSTLVVIDITDPADMQRVAHLRLGGAIVAIVATPDLLYVSSTNDAGIPSSETGLWIVDISNPLSPLKIGFYPSYWTSNLAVQGNFAYLYTGNGLDIIDISTPDNPVRAGMLKDIGGLSDIAISGDYMYLAGDFYEVYPAVRGIMVFDISDPAQPVYAGQYLPESTSYSSWIVISNTTLYYFPGVSELQVLDISAPASPTHASSLYFPPEWSKGLALSGDTAYLAIESCFLECMGGFKIIDVSNPTSPTIIGEYSDPKINDVTSISAVDGHVYLTHRGEVLSVDATVHTSPVLVDSFKSSLDSPRRFAVSGDYAFIIDGRYGEPSTLRIADVSNPSQPVIVGKFPAIGELTDVEVDGDIAILTEQNSLTVIYLTRAYFIDVSNPQNPVEVGRFESNEGQFVGVDAQDGYAYLAQKDVMRMLVLDISDPTQPRQVGYYEPPPSHDFTDVVVQDSYAYLPAFEGMLTLDISDPQEPIKVGEYWRETLWSKAVAISGNYLYLSGCSGVNILDNRNPARPIGIATYEHIGLCDSRIAVQANHLFIAAQDGLLALDISTITTPTLAAFHSSFWGQDVAADENAIFFTSWEGFQTLRMTGSVSVVVRSSNRSAVPGVTMTANGSSTATTNSQGKYTFEGLEPGSYTITPSLAGFTFTPQQIQKIVPPNAVANFTLLPLPVSAELTADITATLTYTDFQGLPTSFIFPAGLVSSTASAYVTPTLATEPFGSAFTGHAFELALLAGGEPVYSTTFPAPVSVVIQYSPLDTAVISDPLMLGLYRQDGAAWVKTEDACPASPAPLPVEPGVFRTAICQSGRYALFGPTHAIALPQVSYGSDASEVILPLTH